MTLNVLSRRRFALQMIGAGAALTASCKAPAVTPVAAQDWLLEPSDRPLDIPLDFVGLHSDHGMGGDTPPPDYPYDAVRSHDAMDERAFPVLQWALIETSAGVYDWTAMDRWIAAHPDKTRIFVLFGCPAFYQKYPGERWRYPYLPGGGSPPKDPAAAARFVRALLDKYPKHIDFLEVWNEPNFHWNGSDPLRDRWPTSEANPGFFTGTASELAALARAVGEVLPARTRLMCGGWEGQSAGKSQKNSLLRFASAPDGKGRKGLDHIQALAVHCYIYKNDPNKLVAELRDYNARFEQAGFASDLPRYVSEIGAEAPVIWTDRVPGLKDKVANLKRWCMIPAALGYRGVYLYKHSLLRTMGDPARTPELGKAIGEVRNGLRGKRLRAAAILVDDTVWMQFDDGSTLRA